MVMIDNGAGPEPSDQLLWSIKTVIAKTGLSRASIYRYIKRERFPPRRRVGPNRVAWVPAEVIAWTEARPKLGQGHGTARNRPVTGPHRPRPLAEASLLADAQPSAGVAPCSASCSSTGTGPNS